MLDASLSASDAVLAEASLAPSDLDAVLLIGGSARLPAVDAAVERRFGAPPLRMDRPEEAIALGAAALAQRMQERQYATS